MMIDMAYMSTILSFIGTGILGGLGFIYRTLGQQNKALAVLVARVGDNDISKIESRVKANETDLARIWGIYDAWKGPSAPSGTERMRVEH